VYKFLGEGGNVFKDAEGQPLTQRINKVDVPATVAWIERVTGINFPQDRWLGSTGRAATSGDLDLAVSLDEVTKDEVAQRLEQWAESQGQDPKDFVRKKGEVHFRTPIAGNASRGFVQTDFMFFPHLDWGTFFYAGGEDSAYKGMIRNVLMSSLAKVQGLKIGANGVVSRATNEVVSMDPDWAAQALLGPGHTRQSLRNVETIYQALANDPKRDAKLADFKEFLAREKLQEPRLPVRENEVGFLARLRDRIVNQGMMPLIEDSEAVVLEAEQPGVGGRAKGIEHLEDLVFRRGPQGIQDALTIVAQAAESPRTVTAKWDGRPAVVFGRKPATGEFVLTDGSGFDAKTYDGMATSPDMMARIQNQRKGERGEITALYRDLWPWLEAATPPNFRGYVKGDLLYTDTPPVVSGAYEFQPNTVKYRIPVNSSLGKRIGDSTVGVAIHSMYADQNEPRQPLSGVRLAEVPGLMLERPASPRELVPNAEIINQLREIMREHGAAMRTLFNPAELRAQQITDLFKLAVDFINTKVGAPLQPAGQLLAEFGQWLQTRVTPRKFANIVEYLKSPSTNSEAMAASFLAFELLHALKMDLLQQADQQHPGQEGWVMATPAGYAKAVSRFDPESFAAQNRARNNPN
jgi:hypothetical protein